MSDIEIEIVEGIAKMLHSYAFANLWDETTCTDTEHPAADEQKAALKGHNPGPGGNWCDSVPDVPSIAQTAAEYVWERCKDTLASYALAAIEDTRGRRACDFGSDLALTVLCTGAGLHDGNWPDIEGHDLPKETGLGYEYEDGFSYYWGDEQGIVVYANAKTAGTIWHRNVACWCIDRFGELECVEVCAT